MIDRYSTEEMRILWSDRQRYLRWREVELLAIEARNPPSTVAYVRRATEDLSEISLQEIRELEEKTGHDVEAFVRWMERKTPDPYRRQIHIGLTSSDVVDSALAMAINSASWLIRDALRDLGRTIARRALSFYETDCAGRTHGRIAEPTKFGFKLALWALAVRRASGRVDAATRDAATGKMSGPVGTYSHIRPEVEDFVGTNLGIAMGPANQIVARDRIAAFVGALALAASTMEAIATEIRLLAQDGINEVAEGASRVGSSSMPHKHNPIGCERICGLARVVRGHALTAMEDVALWGERDISHSSAERIILPDSTSLVEFMAISLTSIVDRLVVDEDRMLANLTGLRNTQGRFLWHVDHGLSRKDAREAALKDAGPWKPAAIPDDIWEQMRSF